MKNSREHAERLATLLRSLRRKYDAPESTQTSLNPVEHIVYSFMLWEARRDLAETAYRNITAGIVDFNELRVFMVDEMIQAIGERYPLARERCERLKRVLTDIHNKEFQVSLDSVQAKGVRFTHTFVNDLDGMTPYVAGRLMLLCCKSHALPVDMQLHRKLVQQKVLETDSTLVHARDWLERNVRAAECLEVHQLFQQWVEDESLRDSERSRSDPGRKQRAADDEDSNDDDDGSGEG